MSHDSRGALLRKGDRVLLEGVLMEDPTADQGFCNASVKFVTPEQRDAPPMDPPGHVVFNTRMLTKVSLVVLLALLLSMPASGAERTRGWRVRAVGQPGVGQCRAGRLLPGHCRR